MQPCDCRNFVLFVLAFYHVALSRGQLAAVDGAAPRQCVARRRSGRKVSRGRSARGVARAGGWRIRRSGRDCRSSVRLRLHDRCRREDRQLRSQGIHRHRACAVPRREDRQAEVALRVSGEVHDVVPGRSALHADCRWRQALHARRRRRSHLLQGRLGRNHLEEKSAEGIPHENRDVGLRQPSADRRQEAHLPGRRRWHARRGARQERRLRDLAIVVVARARLLAADDHRGRRQTSTSPGPAERAQRRRSRNRQRALVGSVRGHQRFDHHVARSLGPICFSGRVREQVAARRDVGRWIVGQRWCGATNRSTASRPSTCSHS